VFTNDASGWGEMGATRAAKVIFARQTGSRARHKRMRMDEWQMDRRRRQLWSIAQAFHQPVPACAALQKLWRDGFKSIITKAASAKINACARTTLNGLCRKADDQGLGERGNAIEIH
jgi:hypothetical protein